MRPHNTIVIHDFFTFKGGGERLVEILCRDLELDLAFGHQTADSFDLGALPGKLFDLHSDGVDIMGWRTLRRLNAFRNKSRILKRYENVIYSGIYSPIAIKNHASGKNIYYCNTPPRFLYDLRDHYISALPLWRRLPLFNFHLLFFAGMYESAIHKMDVVIANSKNIQDRIRKFFGIESPIIYPPCDCDQFNWLGQGDYYLSTARLDPLKRVDVIIEAFTQMPDKKLIVLSEGIEKAKLLALSRGHKNISFAGSVEEKKLKELIGNAIATIYIPKEEDFGLSPVESMAAGKPVLGVAEGGMLETVVHGETGWILPRDPSPEEVVSGVRELQAGSARSMRKKCESRAEMFRKEIFIEKMRKLI